MSHFMTLVLFKKRPLNLQAALADALAPFDENRRVHEYDRPCYCVGRKAELDAFTAGMSAMGVENMSQLRERFFQGPGATCCEERKRIARGRKVRGESARFNDEELKQLDELDAKENKLWAEFIQPAEAAKRVVLEGHPDKTKPDLDCAECHGKGTYRSTYNPKSKWDWYNVGGRWGGFFDGSDVAVLEEKHTEDKYRTFAILAPDGKWHERGEMGWWATVSNENQNWPEQAKALLVKHRGSFAVAVDCHI